jgi:Zn-dependent protease with chaperone function
VDFFAHQDAARKRTMWLVALFLLAVALIITAVHISASLLYFGYLAKNGLADTWSLWDPYVFAASALGTIFVIATGSFFKIAVLRQGGGEAVARMLGGRPVEPGTRDPDERRLLNVVEEMAIASGIPVPAVYLLKDEKSVNAFAAGFSTDQAVIGVTRGCLSLLSRDELQGVIGHEFSHILNGDMMLNLRLMGTIHGILLIALIGYVLMRSSRSSRKGGGQIVLAGGVLFLVGYIGVFIGRIIKAAVSRQREFLADSSAVQFTRNPDGLSGALKKIGGLIFGSRLDTPRAEEASHLFFSNGLKRGFFNAMTTHPPLDERVRRLDPSFDGRFPVVDAGKLDRRSPRTSVPGGPGVATPAPVAAGLAGAPAHGPSETGAAGPAFPGPAYPAREGGPGLDPAAATARVGTLDPAHLDHAARLLSGLGKPLVDHARDLPGAMVIIYAILMSHEEEIRTRQLTSLRGSTEAFVHGNLPGVLETLDRAPREARLPLMDIAIPALCRLSDQQFHSFYQNVAMLVKADEKIDLFEFALQHALRRHVAPHFGTFRAPQIRYRSMSRAAAHVSVLLSAMAWSGQAGPDMATSAFQAGKDQLGPGSDGVRPLPPERYTLEAVGRALDELARAAPAVQRRLIAAGTACVIHDRKVTQEEAELLRAVGDALGCPTPPFIPGVEI